MDPKEPTDNNNIKMLPPYMMFKEEKEKEKKEYSFNEGQLQKILETVKQTKFPEKMSFSCIDFGGSPTWSRTILNRIPHYTLAFGTSQFLIGATNPAWFITLSLCSTEATASVAFCMLLSKMLVYARK